MTKRSRKTITVAVTVSAPPQMSDQAIRRELRWMTGGWSHMGDLIRIKKVSAMPKGKDRG
jgi:hypothetical protein